MSKELEALDRIETFLKENCKHYKQDIDYIKQALQRLESIDNADPSEAMDRLEYICKILHEKSIIDIKWIFKNDYNIIEQALLKAQEDENLKVDICEMFGLDNLFPYNDTKAILKELEEYMGRKNQLWVDFMITSKKLKEQEKDWKNKFADIVINRRVDIKLIFTCNSALEYNEYKENRGYNLSDEEFNFLKEKICR